MQIPTEGDSTIHALVKDFSRICITTIFQKIISILPEFVEIREISLFHYLIWFCYVLLQSNEKNLTKEKTKKIELKKNDLTNGDFQNLLSLIKIFKKSLNHFFSENSQTILIPLLTVVSKY